MKNKSKHTGQGKRKRQEHRQKAALGVLGRERENFSPLIREIVQAALTRFIDPLGGKLLELGSGGGQLALWAPPETRREMVLSDQSSVMVSDLARRFRENEVKRVDAAHLPFEAASFSHVLGLCVFDVFKEPEQVVKELARVLRRGGSFIHFLDLGTSLNEVFAEVVSQGKVPLPNYLDREVLTLGLSPLVDLLAIDAAQLNQVLRLLERGRHPAFAELSLYAKQFAPEGFDSERAARFFVQLMKQPGKSTSFKRLLSALHQALLDPKYRALVSFEPEPRESFGFFRRKIQRVFEGHGGFSIEEDQLVRAETVVSPGGEGHFAGLGYHGRWMANEHWLPHGFGDSLAIPIWGSSASEAATPHGPSAEPSSPPMLRREVVVHVFVARLRE